MSRKMFWVGFLLASLTSPIIAQTCNPSISQCIVRPFVIIPPASSCTVGPNPRNAAPWTWWTYPTGGVYHLPPDIPNPAFITEVAIDVESGWPANAFGPGPSFAAIDHGSSFVLCSHYPNLQDCPATSGANQFTSMKSLVIMMPGTGTSGFVTHSPPVAYYPGDSIVAEFPCNVPTAQADNYIQPAISIGIAFPVRTPTSACSSNIKMLLHGGLWMGPDTVTPLPNFISDSTGNSQMGSTATIDTTTPMPLGPSSIRFNGTSSVYANMSGYWLLGAQNWSLEMFWRPGSVGPSPQQIFNINPVGGSGPISFGQVGSQFVFSASAGGTTWDAVPTVMWGTAVLNQPTHLKIQRVGANILLSQDGMLQATAPVIGNAALFAVNHTPLYIGAGQGGSYPATGNLQELKFQATADGTFTVPTSPYPCP